MKSKLFISIAALNFIIACSNINELDHIDFKVSKDAIIDSLKTATNFLDQMDYGNGTSCIVVDGQLHYTRKEPGFNIVNMPDKSSPTFPIIEPFDQAHSKRFIKLIEMLHTNGIESLGKSFDRQYSFLYKQSEFNPTNYFKDTRIIVYLKDVNDTCSIFFNDHVILDRFKNILLVAPKTYNEPKLPMDKESIMKRTEKILKEKENKQK